MKETQNAKFQRRRTIRLSSYDDTRIALHAEVAGLSVAEYMRREILGGGPIVARVDIMMVNELRRIGGLLKHNFETLRQADAPKELFIQQEKALAELQKIIEIIGERYDHQKTTQKGT